MEKTERTKYYPINLKDKKLHTEFMIFERTNEYKKVDDALRCLLDDSNALAYGKERIELLKTELLETKKKIKELERENHVMQELREVIIPIPREVLSSTPEEIDSLDLSGLELEIRLKTCWKRFANFKELE